MGLIGLALILTVLVLDEEESRRKEAAHNAAARATTKVRIAVREATIAAREPWRLPTPVATPKPYQPPPTITAQQREATIEVKRAAARSIAVAPAFGIGVSRAMFLNEYKGALGYGCRMQDLPDGSPRMICVSPPGEVGVDVFIDGPVADVSRATVVISDPQADIVVSFLHLTLFMGLAVPDWDGSMDWISDNIVAASEDKSPSTRQGGCLIELHWISGGGQETLIVEVST